MNTSKIQLAKLLACEDITVRHSSTAKTASFDVKFRLLTLPNWVTTDITVADLMTGHEVGTRIMDSNGRLGKGDILYRLSVS